MPTQSQYDVSKQYNRKFKTKISLLNYQFQMVDELSGDVVGTPSFNIDATSDIRRTCTISLYPSDTSFNIAFGNKIWLDKYIKVEIGIEDLRTNEVVYTNMGVYLINNPSRVYSADSNILTFEGLDLMAKLTGLRNGNLEGLEHIIYAGENVRETIIDTLALAGFNRYVCEECPVLVPNDLRFSSGGTVYDILRLLANIIPQYQIYFDVDGVFHYELIPSGANEQVFVDDDIWTNNLISYQIDTDFENVKNSIEVYGKTHEIYLYSTNTTISGSTYICDCSSTINDSLVNNMKIGFVAPSKVTNPYAQIIVMNTGYEGGTITLPAKPIKNEDGSFAVLNDASNVYYVIKYVALGDYFLFMGEVTPYAKAEETNPDSPFYINGTLGKIRLVLQGGDYDNIYTSDLALQRAKWELYNYCRINDSITLNCIPIYWMDVNKVIEITLPNKQGTEVTEKYITKQISTTLDVNGTQSIVAMKYYPYHDTE